MHKKSEDNRVRVREDEKKKGERTTFISFVMKAQLDPQEGS